ncbi:hypothetical protein pb186bvf_007751 [Paramecium bursaria]
MDQVSLDEDSFEIQTEVCDPIIKDGLQKYVVYTFKGQDKHGQFDIQRRYNDFDVFRATLAQRWPGCYVPPLPIKKAVGNMDKKFIDERKHYLDLFVKKLATLKHLWYSYESEQFKRNSGEVEKMFKAFPQQSTPELIDKYEKNFKELNGKEINNDIITRLGVFQVFLKKIKPVLENYVLQSKNLVETKKVQGDNMNLLLDYLMPEYEKNCLTEYVNNPEQRLVFLNQSIDQLNQIKIANQQITFETLYLNVKIENREIDSMLETFQQRDKYEYLKNAAKSKLRDLEQEKRDIESGKTSLKTLFNQNKDENLLKVTQKIEGTQKDIENLTILCDFITIIMGYIEIPYFKSDKEQKYLKLLRQVSDAEIAKAKANLEYWQSLYHQDIFRDI